MPTGGGQGEATDVIFFPTDRSWTLSPVGVDDGTESGSRDYTGEFQAAAGVDDSTGIRPSKEHDDALEATLSMGLVNGESEDPILRASSRSTRGT